MTKTQSGLPKSVLKTFAEEVREVALVLPEHPTDGWALANLPAIQATPVEALLSIDSKIVDRAISLERTHGDPTEIAELRRAMALVRREVGSRIEDGRKATSDASDVPLKPAEITRRYEYALVARVDEPTFMSWIGEALAWREMLAAARRWAREKAGLIRERPTGDAEGKGWTLMAGDLSRLGEIAEGSVDLIVTDPPYPKDDLPLWSDLGEWAAKLLAPRGLMLGYTGQIFLPEVMERLGERLTYGWTFALMLPGSGSRIMGRHIIQGWKPVVAYSTGTWPSGEWADDVLVSPDREKDEYVWQQNAIPAQRLIERYTRPGALVLDPFVGSGSFGLAALQAGRTFVGIEPDGDRFEQARERLEGV